MSNDVTQKVANFFAQYRVRKYAKGQVLILNGDTSESIYYLEEGLVKQYDVTYRGDEIILNVFKPFAFFPMSMAVNKTPSPYVFAADSDIRVRQAPAEDVVRFIQDNPDVMFDLLSRVYRGTDGLLGRLAHVMSKSAKGRLMYEILVATRRFGEEQADSSYVLHMSEKDLGANAGLSRETVSREIAKLVKEKMLSHHNGYFTIQNLAIFEDKLNKTS